MSLNRHAKKRDTNEQQIIQALSQMGAYVEELSGAGLPDTLIHHAGHVYRVEIKGAKRGLTRAQVERFALAAAAGVDTFILRSTNDAFMLLRGELMPWRTADGALAGADRKERARRPGVDRATVVSEMCDADGCAISRLPGFRKCRAHMADAVLP